MSFTAKAVGLLGAAALVLVPAGVSVAAPPAGSPAPATSPHMTPPRGAPPVGGGGTSNNLYYHGGVSDGAAGSVGVETSPKVYLVLWGSQWNNNDPSGEAGIVQGFLGGLYGSNDTWSTSTTQYCEGISSGSSSCGGTSVTHPSTTPLPAANVWYDNTSAAPNKPRQSQLANEAINAAKHFGNTTPGSNASVQYVIATAHGFNASGFGTSYCAWHSSVNGSSLGYLAYTNLPYITDAGASCGANFVVGPKDGITIVEGHEYAETVTDQYPNGGWLDSGGAENGDKCAWINPGTTGGAADVNFGGTSYPVQALWSNSLGGCAISYVSATNQHG